MELEFEKYVRIPFVVEAVEITVANIEEIAMQVGTLKTDAETGKPYIWVDKRLVPGVNKVHPGYFMTRMGDMVRCYSPKVFAAQFRMPDANIMEWVEYISSGTADDSAEPVKPATDAE